MPAQDTSLLEGSDRPEEAYKMWKAFAQRAKSGKDARSAAIGYACAADKVEDMGRAEDAVDLRIEAADLYERSGEF